MFHLLCWSLVPWRSKKSGPYRRGLGEGLRLSRGAGSLIGLWLLPYYFSQPTDKTSKINTKQNHLQRGKDKLEINIKKTNIKWPAPADGVTSQAPERMSHGEWTHHLQGKRPRHRWITPGSGYVSTENPTACGFLASSWGVTQVSWGHVQAKLAFPAGNRQQNVTIATARNGPCLALPGWPCRTPCPVNEAPVYTGFLAETSGSLSVLSAGKIWMNLGNCFKFQHVPTLVPRNSHKSGWIWLSCDMFQPYLGRHQATTALVGCGSCGLGSSLRSASFFGSPACGQRTASSGTTAPAAQIEGPKAIGTVIFHSKTRGWVVGMPQSLVNYEFEAVAAVICYLFSGKRHTMEPLPSQPSSHPLPEILCGREADSAPPKATNKLGAGHLAASSRSQSHLRAMH